MITPALVYRANQWLWWRAAVDQYRADWQAARQARYERDLAEVIGILAALMDGAR